MIDLGENRALEVQGHTAKQSRGSVILISPPHGSYRAHSVFSALPSKLNKRGWDSYRLVLKREDSAWEASLESVLEKAKTAIKDKNLPVHVIAEAETEKWALQWLIADQVQSAVLVNATPLLNAQLAAIPPEINGKFIEVCAAQGDTAQVSACEMRADTPLPQLQTYRLPASQTNFKHQHEWLINLMDGFIRKHEKK